MKKFFGRRWVRSQKTERTFAFVRGEGIDIDEGLDVRIVGRRDADYRSTRITGPDIDLTNVAIVAASEAKPRNGFGGAYTVYPDFSSRAITPF